MPNIKTILFQYNKFKSLDFYLLNVCFRQHFLRPFSPIGDKKPQSFPFAPERRSLTSRLCGAKRRKLPQSGKIFRTPPPLCRLRSLSAEGMRGIETYGCASSCLRSSCPAHGVYRFRSLCGLAVPDVPAQLLRPRGRRECGCARCPSGQCGCSAFSG